MINQERLNEIQSLTLQHGNHKSFKDGACVMELVSYIAGEKWTDHPTCACPVMTRYAINLNDRMNDEFRQKLKPFIPRLAASKDKKKEKQRYEFLAHQSITVFLPLLTDALKLSAISARLREFKIGDWIAARDYINSVKPQIRADAAAAAAAAAGYTAYAAAVAADAAAAAAADAGYTAYAAAVAADAAAAAAVAADAAVAAADAAAAAAAAAKKKQFWLEVRNQIWDAALNALKQAIEP